MGILRFVLPKYPALHAQVCSVWLAFVKRLDIAHVGPILAQIFVDLVPCVREGGRGAQKALEVLEYLVIQRKNELKGYFKDIPFFGDKEGTLREIAAVVVAEHSTEVKPQV